MDEIDIIHHQEIIKYRKRVNQLIPRDHYKNDQREPLKYFQKYMKLFQDHMKCIYWYSIFFVNKEFHRLPYVELKKCMYDREIFRYKYIKLAKYETIYQITDFILENQTDIFKVADLRTNKIIEYLLFYFRNITFQFLSCFTKFEIARILYIKDQVTKVGLMFYNFQSKSKSLLFNIFYKSSYDKYCLCPGLIKQIYDFLYEE